MRVLLVEDDAMIAQAVSANLKDTGYAVDWVSLGSEVASAVAAQAYDLLLLDLGLPGKDGLDVLAQQDKVAEFTKILTDAGIRVSLFIDADNAQIQAAYDVGAPVIELHTGAYADAHSHAEQMKQFERIQNGAHYASDLGLVVNAGHGLTIHNVTPIAQILAIRELNIGHSLISQALFLGLPEAVRQMKEVMFRARMLP